MQRTITEQATVLALPQEPETLRSIRADSRIRSIVVVRYSKLPGASEPYNPANCNGLVVSQTKMNEVVLVSDLLEGISYVVIPRMSFYELVFTLKDEQVMIIIEPGSDLTEIAHNITKQLEVIRNSN